MIKICVECGKAFEVEGKQTVRITCSPECKKKRTAQLQRKYQDKKREEARNHKIRICRLCGAQFEPVGYEQTCPECKYELKRLNCLKPSTTPEKNKKPVTVDEILKEAEAAGFEPWQYGKYKTLKTLEKVPRIRVSL